MKRKKKYFLEINEKEIYLDFFLSVDTWIFVICTQDLFCFILTETYLGNDGLVNHRPIPESLKNGTRNIKVIRDCGGMQRFSGDKLYEGDQYNRCQWENIPYERYECQCGPNPNDQVP